MVPFPRGHFLTQCCPVPRRDILVMPQGHNRHGVQLLAGNIRRSFFTLTPGDRSHHGVLKDSGVLPARVLGSWLNILSGTVGDCHNHNLTMTNTSVNRAFRKLHHKAIPILNPLHTYSQGYPHTHLGLPPPSLPNPPSSLYGNYTPITNPVPLYTKVFTAIKTTAMIDFDKICRAIQAFR
jgi:hypothetical protein